MVDLSGGGLKLKVKENINKDDLLLVKIEIKGIEIELKCDIVRLENTPDKEKLCGLKFSDITPVQTDIIIQELFGIIRKQRAKL
jgi:c-di-GMP-binding flagellar brake protein YcgR